MELTKDNSTKGEREFEEIKGTSSKGERLAQKKKGRKNKKKVGTGRPKQSGQNGSGTKPNDISWAMKNPQLIRDVASISFGAMLGTPNPGIPNSPFSRGMIIPGVMAFYWMPALGESYDLNSPVNVCARGVYTYVRKQNSGARNYESADLMMYLMAKDSLDAFHAFLKRTYGVLRTYSAYNRYYAQSILRCMGWDPTDLENNIAELRAFTNLVSEKLGNLATPSNMPVFKRHRHMSEKLYVDGKGSKAQTYVFVPLHFWKFTNTSNTGSALQPVTWFEPSQLAMEEENEGRPFAFGYAAKKGRTLQSAREFFRELYNGVMLDEDFGTMSGDILKAYPESAVTDLGVISEDYSVEIEYSEEILSEIENMTIIGHGSPGTGTSSAPPFTYVNTVTQDPSINNGAILTSLSFTWEDNGTPGTMAADLRRYDAIMNFHWDSPTPEDVITASRFTCDPNTAITSTAAPKLLTSTPKHYGSEVVAFAVTAIAPYSTMPKGVTNGKFDMMGTTVDSLMIHNVGEGVWTVLAVFHTLATITNFDWHPLMRMYALTGSTDTTPELMGILGDLEQYAIVPQGVLQQMHEAVLLSYFDVTR